MTEQPVVGTAERTAGGSQLAWVGDIERLTLANTNFRTVVYTAGHVQLTVMRLGPGEEIGWESHPHLDQFLRIEEGEARLDLGRTGDGADEAHHLSDDWAIIVPAGVWHNVTNTGQVELKLYSLYSPPEHPDGTVHVTKADADADEHD
ncbi:MAG TPA: cupin domain-containing protein [Acidimicrobiales bacterium]|nr:cupin domain-containing protein [Acidimicrobiales bacterium]